MNPKSSGPEVGLISGDYCSIYYTTAYLWRTTSRCSYLSRLQSYAFSLKALLIKENQKLRAISYTTMLNKYQSAICVPLYKRRWLKHWKFYQPSTIHEGEDHKTIPAQGEIRSQIVKQEMSLFEATKTRSNNLEKLFHALITIKSKSVEPERAFLATDLFVRSSEADWMMKVCFDCHASAVA